MATTTAALQNFINGEYVDPADGQTELVINSATGDTIAHVPLSTVEDMIATDARLDSWMRAAALAFYRTMLAESSSARAATAATKPRANRPKRASASRS